MSLKDFAQLDPRDARRLVLGSLPADYRGSFAVAPTAAVKVALKAS